jgi:hypothetical protein
MTERPRPKTLHLPQYLQGDEVRLVRQKGEIKFKGKLYYVGQAFTGLEVALRPTDRDGYFELFFGRKKSALWTSTIPPLPNNAAPLLCSLLNSD